MPQSLPPTPAALMDGFARDTGVEGDAPQRRYLWTDAFAVCNELGLAESTGDPAHLRRALRLVEAVHEVLGRHRDDDPRTGWISGLPEAEGRARPTAGGLRIGKPLPERAAGEPYDARLEWERDGQYFHYLTKWMHALHRMHAATGVLRHHRDAVELARVACQRFILPSAGGARMAWKMSVDLSRPLVDAMGQHDPLDGLVTVEALRAARAPLVDAAAGAGGDVLADEAAVGAGGDVLAEEAATLAELCATTRWVTDDPLGIGGLLLDVYRLVPVVAGGRGDLLPLLERLLSACHRSLEAFPTSQLRLRPERRLAFRELGLSIGLRALQRLLAAPPPLPGTAAGLVAGLEPWLPLAQEIEEAWSPAEARLAPTWIEHADINRVMLATTLAPDGFLGPPGPS